MVTGGTIDPTDPTQPPGETHKQLRKRQGGDAIDDGDKRTRQGMKKKDSGPPKRRKLPTKVWGALSKAERVFIFFLIWEIFDSNRPPEEKAAQLAFIAIQVAVPATMLITMAINAAYRPVNPVPDGVPSGGSGMSATNPWG